LRPDERRKRRMLGSRRRQAHRNFAREDGVFQPSNEKRGGIAPAAPLYLFTRWSRR